jgi:carbonic anhydrase/acetyltransferase-like protein (isoleucine patch superfamily)
MSIDIEGDRTMTFKHTCTFVYPGGVKVTAHRWKNPDGTLGGFVADNAQVHSTATVELGGMVAPLAIVAPGQIVKQGEIVCCASTADDQSTPAPAIMTDGDFARLDAALAKALEEAKQNPPQDPEGDQRRLAEEYVRRYPNSVPPGALTDED